ncbi:hypothetical protein CPC16_009631 [Podila verticillata]|nr:hypothetical protein BGZ52_003643 [Haplosporangium bisporale]KAF9215143.1 hypothetical protein BGZ59_002201 [Podila verticillata]KAF9381908.1 hypothetical protein CPC16_009631 [Podila verticillata]KFH72341.1 hypothetical protein MVEG_02632 [Podila verticillata NRRL 6337]
MPRRKITSKRIPANHRYKIEKRVKDHHRKLRKDAKSNPNAHHKNKKDPGIPNNYPFKEQLLQQIADQKLKAAEEKERQKLARRATQDKARQLKKGANKTNNTNTENKSAAKSKATDASKSSEKAKASAKGKKEFAATAAAVAAEESDEDGDAPYNFGEHFTATNDAEDDDEEEEDEEEEDEE